jgi:hypothetical protein
MQRKVAQRLSEIIGELVADDKVWTSPNTKNFDPWGVTLELIRIGCQPAAKG